jgi:hypothetical protein
VVRPNKPYFWGANLTQVITNGFEELERDVAAKGRVVELIQGDIAVEPEVQVRRTNVLTAVPVCPTRLPELTCYTGFVPVNLEPEVAENFHYQKGQGTSDDDVVTIDSEVCGYSTGLCYSVAKGGEQQRLKWEAEAIAHRNKLFVTSHDATIFVTMRPGSI